MWLVRTNLLLLVYNYQPNITTPIFQKKARNPHTNVEKERIARNRTTEITGDKMYVVALTNEEKVVIAKCLKEKAGV